MSEQYNEIIGSLRAIEEHLKHLPTTIDAAIAHHKLACQESQQGQQKSARPAFSWPAAVTIIAALITIITVVIKQ